MIPNANSYIYKYCNNKVLLNNNFITSILLYYEKNPQLMKSSTILIYALCGLLLSVSAVYFLVAHGEYVDLLDFLDAGIQGETFEHQVEMGLFVPTGIAYVFTTFWILRSKLQSKIPYLIVIAGSATMILIYVASRTVGVPPIGVEYYVGRLDIISKILQVFIIGLSVCLLIQVKKTPLKKIAS